MSGNTGTLVEVLTATGALTAVSEGVRWWFGRNKTKIESAQVVQGMAIDLLKPLHDELQRANAQIEALRKKADEVVAELDRAHHDLNDAATWALAAKALLDDHSVSYPVLPAVLRRARGG